MKNNKSEDWRVQVFEEIMQWPRGREQTLALIEHILFSGGRLVMRPEGGANVVWDDEDDQHEAEDEAFFARLQEKQKTQSP